MSGKSVEQDQARGGDVERKPEKRDKQKQGGKARKIRRVFDV